MGHLASTDIDTEYDLYYDLIATMTYSASATALAIYKQRAENELKAWYSARLALLNLEKSAASSYSSGVGMSVNKRQTDEAQASVEEHFEAFVRLLAMGGVTLPTVGESSAALWTMNDG